MDLLRENWCNGFWPLSSNEHQTVTSVLAVC